MWWLDDCSTHGFLFYHRIMSIRYINHFFKDVSFLTMVFDPFIVDFNLSLPMGHKFFWSNDTPGDSVTNVKQIESQSDLASMSSFADPSHLTVRSSLCIILI